MLSYVVRRLLLMIVTLFGVSIAIFLLLRIVPGNIADILFDSAGMIDPAEKQKIDHRSRTGSTAAGAIRAMDRRPGAWRPRLFLRLGKTGASTKSCRASRSPRARRPGACFSPCCIGVPLGVISAVRQNTGLDYVLRVLSLSVLSMPSFWLGLLVLMAFVHYFGTIPIYERDPRDLLGLAPDAQHSRRRRRLPQFGADHAPDPVLDAGGAAPGLRPHRALQGPRPSARSPIDHALRNAVLPVITMIGVETAFLMGGLIVTETVFNIPGVARFLVEAIRWRDYPMVQNLVMFIALVVVTVNLHRRPDLHVVDPRIRYGA